MSLKSLLPRVATQELIRLVNAESLETSDWHALRREIQGRLPEPEARNEAIYAQIGLERFAAAFYDPRTPWSSFLDREFLQTRFDKAVTALPVLNRLVVKMRTEYTHPDNYPYEVIDTLTPHFVTLETVGRICHLGELGKRAGLDLGHAFAPAAVKALNSLDEAYFGVFPKNQYPKDQQNEEWRRDRAIEAMHAAMGDVKPPLPALAFKLESALTTALGSLPEAAVKPLERIKEALAAKKAADLKKIAAAIDGVGTGATARAFDSIAGLVPQFTDEELGDSLSALRKKGVGGAFIAAVAEHMPPARVATMAGTLAPA